MSAAVDAQHPDRPRAEEAAQVMPFRWQTGASTASRR